MQYRTQQYSTTYLTLHNFISVRLCALRPHLIRAGRTFCISNKCCRDGSGQNNLSSSFDVWVVVIKNNFARWWKWKNYFLIHVNDFHLSTNFLIQISRLQTRLLRKFFFHLPSSQLMWLVVINWSNQTQQRVIENDKRIWILHHPVNRITASSRSSLKKTTWLIIKFHSCCLQLIRFFIFTQVATFSAYGWEASFGHLSHVKSHHFFSYRSQEPIIRTKKKERS